MNVEKISSVEYKYTFANSTPTIGNLLQKELLRDPNITFAGYNCPHPLETKMILSIITSGKNPKELLINAINNLVIKLDSLHELCEQL